jgi:alkylated DNA repair dioxygenase AlkB
MTLQFKFFDRADDDHESLRSLQGLQYRPALINHADENALIEHIRELPFREFDFHGYKGKRRVVSFGWQYDFSGRQLRKADDIPHFLRGLRVLAAKFANLEPTALQQALVTEYGPGAGIGWHRDKAVFGKVVGISLLSACILRFRRKMIGNTSPQGPPSRQWERVNLPAEPRSAYLLDGPARAEWEHSIARVDSLRYSITFRNVLER